MTGGDSFGGATPPISNFFEDRPTPPIMNMMGIDVEAFGNHTSTAASSSCATELIPLADFAMISANVVFPNGQDAGRVVERRHVFNRDGIKLGRGRLHHRGHAGLLFPGRLGPFQVATGRPGRERRGGSAASQGADVDRRARTRGRQRRHVTEPTGPLIDIADNVDRRRRGHRRSQRPPGERGTAERRAVTENRGKGIRFTRIRLVVDTSTTDVVYKTADFHRPWNIGVTPDPAIQAHIDALNAQLAPIFNTVIGESTVFIPRADSCGTRTAGLCESLVGNVVTDAMRTTYPRPTSRSRTRAGCGPT